MNIPQPQSQGRITSPSMSVLEVVMALAEDNMGAAKVLIEVLDADPMGLVCLQVIDNKRLYGSRIWQLYELCGRDIKRFMYHVNVELPNQETGVLPMSVSRIFGPEEWLAKRQFGQPGSFWALENPPTEPDYAFPIE